MHGYVRRVRLFRFHRQRRQNRMESRKRSNPSDFQRKRASDVQQPATPPPDSHLSPAPQTQVCFLL